MSCVEIRFGLSKSAISEMNRPVVLMLMIAGVALCFGVFRGGLFVLPPQPTLVALVVSLLIALVLFVRNRLNMREAIVISPTHIKHLSSRGRVIETLEWDEVEELLPLGNLPKSSFKLSSSTSSLVVSRHFESILVLRELCGKMPDADDEERARIITEHLPG